jgi:hypothetical protein
MARQLATPEAVSAAADALVAEGIAEPSVKQVQERTGGSYSTVKPLLEAWAAKRRSEASSVALPPEIEARGREFVQGLFAHAVKAANAAAAEPLAAAEAGRTKAEGLLAGAEAEVRRLEAVEQEQGAQLAQLTEHARSLEIALAARDATIAEKGAAVTRLEEQLAEAQRGLAANAQELADLRAAARTYEALQAQMETLQRSIQGLAAGDGAARS